jgi:cytochrome b
MKSHLVRVWDLPTRLFHWALVVCIVGLVTTAQIGGNAMEWHFRFGYSVLTLLLFRLLWGFVGGHWSRFSTFLYSPASLLRYLRGHEVDGQPLGHSPLGALSVFAILGLLLLQVGTGLFSDDEIAAVGPLSKLASGAVVSQLTHYHKDIGKVIVLILVLLHIGAIAFYRIKRKKDLIRPMLIGDVSSPTPQLASRDDAGSRALAAVILLGSAGAVAALLKQVA